MRTIPFSRIRSFVLAVAFFLLAGGIGYRLGQQGATVSVTPDRRLVINQTQPVSVTTDFSLFWDVWQRVFQYYIDAKDIEPQKLVEGAIRGMVNAVGDPYTTFLPVKENNEFKQDLGGQFEGIGAQLGLKDNHIIVIAPLKGTPAEKAGIKPGDWIIKVNDEDTVGWTIPQAVTKIRGPRGTKVSLQILHTSSDKPADITITRDTILVPSVDSWMKTAGEVTEITGLPEFTKLKNLKGTVAYLHLSRFGDHTNEDWDKAVNEIKGKVANGSVRGLIFDLRNNPGGYLDGSVWIASEFLEKGTVVSQVNSDGSKQDYPVVRRGRLLDIPMVVLINQGSASAAEIVSGALRDYARGKLVGETSFGKGSVQTPQELTGGGALHVTTGKWLLPKGDWIHKKGITPDVLVKMEDYTASTDAQLAKAIELILQ